MGCSSVEGWSHIPLPCVAASLPLHFGTGHQTNISISLIFFRVSSLLFSFVPVPFIYIGNQNLVFLFSSFFEQLPLSFFLKIELVNTKINQFDIRNMKNNNFFSGI
ncbi:hypothetical protein NC651_024467 [Populus alba x Populus x berolinensis]|nr:hypothetical protein NC651_024467 [Populus alba x Populus x berolinensis]